MYQVGVPEGLTRVLNEPNLAYWYTFQSVAANPGFKCKVIFHQQNGIKKFKSYKKNFVQQFEAPWQSKFPGLLAYGIRKDSPYKAILKEATAKIVESGQLKLLTQRYSTDVSQCVSKSSSQAQAISLEKIISLFMGYFLGSIALPVWLLILELVLPKMESQQTVQPKRQKSLDPRILESLTDSLKILNERRLEMSPTDIIDQLNAILFGLKAASE